MRGQPPPGPALGCCAVCVLPLTLPVLVLRAPLGAEGGRDFRVGVCTRCDGPGTTVGGVMGGAWPGGRATAQREMTYTGSNPPMRDPSFCWTHLQNTNSKLKPLRVSRVGGKACVHGPCPRRHLPAASSDRPAHPRGQRWTPLGSAPLPCCRPCPLPL